MKKLVKDIKIVIIEDDKEKREELVEILRDLGISLNNINQSKYAEKGIELINDELPDVVLLDLKIPYNEDDEKIKIDNSNKVIKEVERLNAVRNLEDTSTGILIISASVQDQGIRKSYKQVPEVVDFFDKDQIALNEQGFKKDLLKKIHVVIERDFKHETVIEYKEIQNVKINKLNKIHPGLYNRVKSDLFEIFEKLNSKNSNKYGLAKSIIGNAGIIVEDIVNNFEDKEYVLTSIDDRDNSRTIRKRLNNLTGRNFINPDIGYEIIDDDPIISRKTAEFARFAYQLRSEILHSKEADTKNNKLFIVEPTIHDASVSINLVMPLIDEFINYYNH